MVELYYRLVKAGVRTIEQVPLSFRAQVQALIEERQESTNV